MEENLQQNKVDEKLKTIFVNGDKKTWAEKEINYDQVISLAYNGQPPAGDNWVFTVTYHKGESKKDGTLVKGESVHVKDGMVFDVVPSNRS